MRSLVNLLVVALAYVQSNITDAGEYRASSYVFGTLARITVVDDDPARAQRAAASMFREFDRMHRDLHAWQPGELVALNEAIARGETHVATTAEIAALIQEARRFSERSGELFNPAIGKLVALWSFHRDEPGGPLPDPSEIARIVHAHTRMADLTVRGTTVSSSNPAVRLDFGGYAKGYALDRAAAILRESGVASALVNVGGNILALGRQGDRNLRRLPQVLHRGRQALLSHHRSANRLSVDGSSFGHSGCPAAARGRRAIRRRKQAAVHRGTARLGRGGRQAGHHAGAARRRRGAIAGDARIGAAVAGTRRRGAKWKRARPLDLPSREATRAAIKLRLHLVWPCRGPDPGSAGLPELGLLTGCWPLVCRWV